MEILSLHPKYSRTWLLLLFLSSRETYNVTFLLDYGDLSTAIHNLETDCSPVLHWPLTIQQLRYGEIGRDLKLLMSMSNQLLGKEDTFTLGKRAIENADILILVYENHPIHWHSCRINDHTTEMLCVF